jgi:hypothetical protein
MLGMEIVTLLMQYEPELEACDLEATGRAAAVLADLLGCVLAAALARTPQEYPDFFIEVCERINTTALRTVTKASETQIPTHRTLQ